MIHLAACKTLRRGLKPSKRTKEKALVDAPVPKLLLSSF